MIFDRLSDAPDGERAERGPRRVQHERVVVVQGHVELRADRDEGRGPDRPRGPQAERDEAAVAFGQGEQGFLKCELWP